MKTENRLTKSQRILQISEMLSSGKRISKAELANRFGVDDRTIQRDIAALNQHLAETKELGVREIQYNVQDKVYEMSKALESALTGGELFAIVKILLESRALIKKEMDSIINKLIQYSEEQNQKEVKQFILNERYHYKPLQHKKALIEMILDLMNHIKAQKKIHIRYIRQDQKIVERTIMPLSIMFSEYYFYMVAYQREEDCMPIMYRLDRIVKYEALDEKYRIVNATRFEEGEFRKRIQFMYPGELMKITLKFWGQSLEALLDHLPTAQVLEGDGAGTTVQVEVYGKGIKMWILSQADRIEVLEPVSFREEMKMTIEKMVKIYR